MGAASKPGWGMGRVAGLDLYGTPAMLLGTVLIWGATTAFGALVLNFGIGNALLGGLLVAVVHWLAEFVHNVGHATIAKRTGHPMTGVRFGYLLVFATSLYPPDEPELEAAIHVRRALGGPLGGTAFAAVVGIALLGLWATGSPLTWAGVIAFLDAFLVFGVGAFVPLGFTDGSTLLRWRART